MAYIAIVLLLLFSAFFSGTEIAYTSLNKLKLKKEGEGFSRLQRLVNYIYSHYDHALATVLIGNNLVNIAATSIATVLAVNLAAAAQGRLTDDAASAVVTVVMTVLILIFGEITPKILGSRRSEAITRLAAWPLLLLMILFSPVVFLSTAVVNLFSRLWRREGDDSTVTITEEELENILDTVEDEGIMDESRTDLLQSALEFTDLDAGDILTPRIDVVGFEVGEDLETVLATIRDTQFSRYPVYERTMDHVVGVLYARHLLRALAAGETPTLRELLLEAAYIPRSMKLHGIMNAFRSSQTHMAVVADEYGGTAGIVTMEDVLEQLVGEIWDENDDIISDWQQFSDTRWECSGDMNLSEFFDELDLDDREIDSDCATVGGWATEMIGAMPVEFDAFDYKRYTILVKQVGENHRITRLLILAHTFDPERD